MTTGLVEGGRPIARFRLFGFPVTIDISFLIVVAILGWYPGVQARDFVIWLLVVPLAILVHELGHAFVARTTGASPQIALAGLGGVTSYVPPHPLSRARSVAISVAGPAVGIAVGLLVLAYGVVVEVGSDVVVSVLNTVIFTTLGWSLLNLLPIVPLDGGQTLRELLPGSPAKRAVRAAAVSVGFAVAVGIVAVIAGYIFGALLAGFLVLTNVMTLRHAHDEGKVDINNRVLGLLAAERTDEARELVADAKSGAQVDPLVRATARAVGEDGADGRHELEAAAARDPHDPTAASLLLLVHQLGRDWKSAADVVARSSLPAENVLAAQTTAFRAAAFRGSAEIGQAWLDRADSADDESDGTQSPGLVAYNTACGWTASGDRNRGLAAFRQAADLGFADLTTVDSDEDIAPLRPLPGYDEARQLIRARALQRSEQASRE